MNNLFFKKITAHWKRLKKQWHIEFCWFHMVFPFILSFALLFLVLLDNVLFMKDNYLSFLRDTSNSICLILFFSLSYYLSLYYRSRIKKSLHLLDQLKKEEEPLCPNFFSSSIKIIAVFVIILTFIIVFCCVWTASIPENMWLYFVSNRTKLFYGFYLSTTAFLGIVVLLYALVSSHKHAEKLTSLNDKNFNTSISGWNLSSLLHEVSRVLGVTISYASIYVMGLGLIIFNDFRNYKHYGISLFFHAHPSAALLMIFLATIVIFYMVIPVIKFREKVRDIKLWKLETIVNPSEEDVVRKISTSVFSNTLSKITLFVSTVGPLLGGILGAFKSIYQ